MENILVVVFDNAKKADDAFRALNELDCDGIITVHAGAVIEKDANGIGSVKDTQGDFPSHTIAGTALGSLIGLLGGLAGFSVGATIGGITGIVRDLHAAGANRHFVEEVSAILQPGKFAIVADVKEQQTAPVDVRMEGLGGIVFRTEKQNFEDEVRAQEITKIGAEIDELKREEAMAMSDRKGKIQAQIDILNQHLQQAKVAAEERTQQLKRETEAKVEELQKKAAKAQGETKVQINARIDQLRQQYQDSVAKLKNVKSENSSEGTSKTQKAG